MKTILLIILLSLTGCFLTPLIDSFNQSGMNSAAREDLLPKRVKEFYNEVVASRFLNFGKFLVKENQDQLLRQLRESRREERVTNAKLDFVDFDEKSNNATVDVVIEFYKIPYYVVNERIERQEWVFTSYHAGWQLKSIEIVE